MARWDITYHFFVDKKNTVGPRVKLARRTTKPPMSQADLVARLEILGLNMSQSGISKIEIGLREVTDIEVQTLAKALKVSIAWLYGEVESR